MSEKRYTIINKEEPRGQSVAYNGMPCTARTCVTRLNRLTEENEQLKLVNGEMEDYLTRLEEENEELKQANQELTQKKNDLKDFLVNSEAILEQKKLQKIIYKMVIDLIDEKIEKVDTVSAESLKDLKRQLEGILND